MCRTPVGLKGRRTPEGSPDSAKAAGLPDDREGYAVAVQSTAGRTNRAGRTPGPGLAGWTTRRWLTTGVVLAMTALLVLGALGGWVLNRASSASADMVDHSSPALVAAVRLENALIDQETGIRGYSLTGQTAFLQPYTQGLSDEQAAAASLRTLLAGDRVAIDQLDQVLARAQTWQTDTAQPIAQSPPGTQVALANQHDEAGKAEFDAVRAEAAVQQQHLQAEHNSAYAALERTHALRDGVLAAIGLVVALLAVLVFAGLRRGVTSPLERLSRDVRLVSGGDFSRAITASGPADLRRLAEDVEAMRRRLAEELELTDRAHRLLDEQAAELRRSNAELEQFAYVASHDLQEPLRKVSSFCRLLQRRYTGRLDERADQYIDFAVDGADRMQTLISDLLLFSRVGRVHQRHASVDLDEVMARTVDSLSLSAAEAGAVITHDPLPTVTADPTQMGMLLQNLLGNAVKFHDPQRPPRIHLSARRDADQWSFAVTDNGVGISPENAERVFVIFQRLQTRDACPGNGIGLAMCRKIVEFHGGTIAVDPGYSPGTRIAFTLPASVPAPATVDPADARGGAIRADAAPAGWSA